ncbi:MAG TPA: VOC family protein [Patescibacteria group bacterium]|nr:VOC family protein [Patescibacteria group bacterium]
MSDNPSCERLEAIDHINLVVHDLETSAEFFEELGFERIGEGDLRGEWVDKVVGLDGVDARFIALGLPMGQAALELLSYRHPQGESDPDKSRANQEGFRHVAFKVSGIDFWHEKLEKMGVECLSDVQEVPNYRGKRMFYFIGPEGVLLEMAEYPDEET